MFANGIVSGIGGAADVRHRPSEFTEQGPLPKGVLLSQLNTVVGEAKAVLSQATTSDMLSERRIQGFNVSGWGALFDSLPHFKGHTQEVICLTRCQLGDRYQFHWQPATSEQGAP
jgi:hypothetical protein